MYSFQVNFTGASPTSTTGLPSGWSSAFAGSAVTITHTVGRPPCMLVYVGHSTADGNWHYRLWSAGNQLIVQDATFNSTFSCNVVNTTMGTDSGGYGKIIVTF